MKDIVSIKRIFIQNINSSSSFEEAIELCCLFEKIININLLPLYVFPEMEEVVYERFLADEDFSEYFSEMNLGTLHVITEGYKTGGHTRLMERLASLHEGDASLLVTKNMFSEIKDIFENVYFVNGFEVKERLLSIIKIVSSFNKVVLHIHPDDIVFIMAMMVVVKFRPDISFYFVNHADHQFSFGRARANVVLEVGSLGFYIKNKFDLNYCSSFLGIPLDSEFDKINIDPKSLGNDIVTAGAAWKFHPLNGFSMQKILYEIFYKNKNIKIKVIGVNIFRDFWWWMLKIRFPNRLHIYRSLDYNSYISIVGQARIYLDSYPITGGTAYAEALSRGSLTIGFKPLLSGFTPLDRLRFNNVDEVIKTLENSCSYINQLYSLREDLVYWHSMKNVKDRYFSALNNNCINFHFENKELVNVEKYFNNIRISFLNNIKFNSDNPIIFRKWFLKIWLRNILYISPFSMVKNFIKIFRKAD